MKRTIRIIFAWIALGGMLGVVIFGSIMFFNIANESATTYGTVTMIFACVTAAFGVASYVLREPEPTTLGVPESDSDGVAQDGENEIDQSDDNEIGGEGRDKGENEEN